MINYDELFEFINSKASKKINIVTGDVNAENLSAYLQLKGCNSYFGFDTAPSMFPSIGITDKVFIITWNMEFIDYLLKNHTKEIQVFTLRLTETDEIEYWYFTGEQALDSRQNYSLELR
jgi:hypothetical protein